MGWNSFDCFGSSVTEAEVLENAKFQAERLAPFGWDHVVVDYCWSHPNPPASTNPNQLHENQPYLEMDGDYRLFPAPQRFPSAARGRGFRPLADKIHGLGLKFGIHIMRGFPRQGIYPGYPARTLGFRPPEMADASSECPWLNHMVGVRLDHPGGQAYYNHIFRLYAEWQVDLVKVDDISFPYRTEEIEAVDRARKACGREILLSLSPGPCPLEHAGHVARHAELWRICADFWDDWAKLRAAFDYCRDWAAYREPGHWPDADMLPLGRLSKRGPVGPEHDSYFSRDEQITLMSLWCIFRSPLFMGGHLPDCDDETISLLTNPEVLAVHRLGLGGYPVKHDACSAVWMSPGSSAGELHLALFNLDDQAREVGVEWDTLGLAHDPTSIRDLWERANLPRSGAGFSTRLAPHASQLLTIQFEPTPAALHAAAPAPLRPSELAPFGS